MSRGGEEERTGQRSRAGSPQQFSWYKTRLSRRRVFPARWLVEVSARWASETPTRPDLCGAVLGGVGVRDGAGWVCLSPIVLPMGGRRVIQRRRFCSQLGERVEERVGCRTPRKFLVDFELGEESFLRDLSYSALL